MNGVISLENREDGGIRDGNVAGTVIAPREKQGKKTSGSKLCSGYGKKKKKKNLLVIDGSDAFVREAL